MTMCIKRDFLVKRNHQILTFIFTESLSFIQKKKIQHHTHEHDLNDYDYYEKDEISYFIFLCWSHSLKSRLSSHTKNGAISYNFERIPETEWVFRVVGE